MTKTLKQVKFFTLPLLTMDLSPVLSNRLGTFVVPSAILSPWLSIMFSCRYYKYYETI